MVSSARSIGLTGREAHNKAANHPLGLWVFARTRGRGLLHARDHQARLWGLDWWRVCWVIWVGRDRVLRGLGLVANTICFDAVFSPALLPGPLDLTHANLPRHLANCPALWVARPGGVPLRRGGHRPAPGLSNRGVAPILADAVTYVALVVLGHAAMRLVAGPACKDELARTHSKLP